MPPNQTGDILQDSIAMICLPLDYVQASSVMGFGFGSRSATVAVTSGGRSLAVVEALARAQ